MSHDTPNQEHFERALQALRVYKERGEQILAALENGESWDIWSRLLRRRDAAFHNFCALDEIALRHGFDIAADGAACKLWEEIAEGNRALEQTLSALREKTAMTLERLRDGSRALSPYHAPKAQEQRLRKCV